MYNLRGAAPHFASSSSIHAALLPRQSSRWEIDMPLKGDEISSSYSYVRTRIRLYEKYPGGPITRSVYIGGRAILMERRAGRPSHIGIRRRPLARATNC